jgi:hypothetical protein
MDFGPHPEEWSATLRIGGRNVEASMRCDDAVDATQLARVAPFVEDAAIHDARARAAIRRAARDPDSDVALYLEHHVALRAGRSAAALLDDLAVRSISLFPDDDDVVACFDYALEPGATHDVLSAHFDARGQIVEIVKAS